MDLKSLVSFTPLTTIRANQQQQQQQQLKKASSSSLPNDSCQETLFMEKEFLLNYTPKPYKYNGDDLSTVIFSRTLQTLYIWPIDKHLTIDDLSKFAENGHTLGIDNTRNYCRIFALDLDCICRKNLQSLTHLNDTLVARIEEKVKATFNNVLNIPNIMCCTWRNKCGYHIYTNINVSLPTHLYLKKIIEVDFRQDDVVIEIPSIMPLPYSAKVRGVAYQPALINARELNRMPLTAYKDMKYVEMYEYTPLSRDEYTIAKITTMSGDVYLNRMQTPIIRTNIPRLTQITSVSLIPEYQYMSQFQTYISLMVQSYNESMVNIGDIDFGEFNEEIRYDLQKFMTMFNQRFTYQSDPSVSCARFIELSAEEYGGFYLQPFIVALYKFIDVEFNIFKDILRVLYASILNTNAAVSVFIDKVHIATMQSYNCTCDEIIDHLYYLIIHSVDPTASLNEQINSIMCSLTLEPSHENVSNLIFSKKKRSEQEPIINNIIDLFMKIVRELKLIYFNRVSMRYYVLDSQYGAYYESCSKLTDSCFPSILRTWIGDSAVASACLKHYIEHCLSKFVIEPVSFTESRFMFSTSVGVFNSATGLYTAKTCLLRFTKYRKFAVWDNTLDNFKMNFMQNGNLLEKLEIAKKYATLMHSNVTQLYIHAVVAPALIQMRKIMSIEECRLSQLFDLLSNHENFESAHFLVEYFPINPKFIYLMLYLYNKYDGFDVLLSYVKLCNRIFNYDTVDESTWRNKFIDIMESATYDTKKETYMEQLLSLKGPYIDVADESTYFFMVIASACMIKCSSFRSLVAAFDITMPEIRHEHSEYTNFNYNTDLKAMRSHMIRARKLVFGENLSKFESNLADECFSISLSTNFNPETTSNYIDSIALSFVPYNILKKIIIFHGEGDVGKSYLCNKLQELTGPQVGRFRNLSKVLARCETTAENFITIINEAKDMDASELKSITGNDAESAMKFYSQKYEMQLSQSLMYGATNVHIEFKSGRNEIDRTTVNRIYSILLTGKHCSANTEQASLFAMLTDGEYFSNIFPVKMEDAVFSLGWISFASYLLRRDENYYPHLNTNSAMCREYQNRVYYNNSKLYKFIVNAGLIDEPKFYISTAKLLDIIKQNLDRRDNNGFATLAAFKTKFEQQFNINFNNATKVPNFQQSGLIQHIYNNMGTMKCDGSVITAEEIDCRLKIYTLTEHRDNARGYFQRKHEKYYDYDAGVYRNIAFQNESSSYEGNELDSVPAFTNSSSLVLTQV